MTLDAFEVIICAFFIVFEGKNSYNVENCDTKYENNRPNDHYKSALVCSWFTFFACILRSTAASFLLDALRVLVIFANDSPTAVVFAAKDGATLVLTVIWAALVVAHGYTTRHHRSTL